MKTTITALPKLFTGIDIHNRSWKLHCNTDLFAGKSFTTPPDLNELLKYVQKHFPDHQVFIAYVAGCRGYSAHRKGKNAIPNPIDWMRSLLVANLKTINFKVS